MADTALKTTTLSVRLTLREPPIGRYNLLELTGLLRDIQGLMTLSSFIKLTNDLEMPRYGGKLPIHTAEDLVFEDAQRVAQSYQVGAFTYNSPPDLVLTATLVSGAVTAVATAAYGLVNVWDKWEDVLAKRKKRKEAHPQPSQEIEGKSDEAFLANQLLVEELRYARTLLHVQAVERERRWREAQARREGNDVQPPSYDEHAGLPRTPSKFEVSVSEATRGIVNLTDVELEEG